MLGRLSLFALLVLVPACSAIVQPDPNRLDDGVDGGPGGLDTPRVDSPILPGDDVPIVVEPDVPVTDLCLGITCPSGEVCVDGVCSCPADACCPECDPRWGECVLGSCTPCGGTGETCCSGDHCRETDDACQGGTCTTCGDPGALCCPGDNCRGGTSCIEGVCLFDDCGLHMMPCCTGGACAEGAVCVRDIFGARCLECGSRGEPCCEGRVCEGDGVICGRFSGQCDACGGIFQPCCPGDLCREGACDRTAGICRRP